MKYIRRPSWWIPENQVTPEPMFWNRRAFLAAAGVASVGAYAGWSAGPAVADQAGEPWTPAPPTNPAFADAGRPVTDEEINSTYNNFYEFASHKRIHREAQALPTEGWVLKVDGMVEQPIEIAVEDLLKKVSVEERIYRHRCVEAWSMVAPWIGFELSEILNMAAPLSRAKYVRFESFDNDAVARNQRTRFYPWPYVEGLTVEEAAHPLTFMVVGAYGKVLPKQFGAPIRLHTPWKYGFKCIKSVTKITLTDERPVSFWEELQGAEYGFWANVNPAYDHPRWSQATERVLGQGEERIPTLLYNGYAEEVAGLYDGLGLTGRTLYY